MITSTNLSPNKYTGHQGPVVFIGIHTMEAPEGPQTAENVANYFKNPAVKASAHWCVDTDSRVRCVLDSDSAWTMPPVNGISMNVEMAGYAGQGPAQWTDAASNAILSNAAVCVAEWCRKYAIPVRHLTGNQIAAKEKGIVGHVDVNNVFHQSDHWDPGPNFPWPAFLNKVLSHLTTLPVAKPDCTPFQQAVRTTPDNLWGPDTDQHASALIAATDYGGHKFPYGIRFTQLVVGTVQDGFWGPLSKTALATTVRSAQNALQAMGFSPGIVDGIWGPNTDRAYHAARTACHI